MNDIRDGRACGGLTIDMNKIKLEEGISFITKFTKVFRRIETIDFGENKLDNTQVKSFGDMLKSNKYVKSVNMKRNNVSRGNYSVLQTEIERNKQISAINSGHDYNTDDVCLDLADAKL